MGKLEEEKRGKGATGFFEEANIMIITKLVRREVSMRDKINMKIWQGHRFVGRGDVEEMLGVILS